MRTHPRLGYVLTHENNIDFSGVIDQQGINYSDLYNMSGNNLGNYIFKYAGRKLFNSNLIHLTYNSDISYV